MSTESIDADRTVDSRGATCPGPMMDLVGAIRDAEVGDVIELLSDAEQSTTDIPAWADESGNEVLAIDDAGDHYQIYVRKT